MADTPDKKSKDTGGLFPRTNALMPGEPATPAMKGWDDRKSGRSSATRDVAPGEFGDLLERYNALAGELKIKNPPPLRISLTPGIGMVGATGTTEAVTVRKKLTEILTRQEMDFVLAHELGHVKKQREEEAKRKAAGPQKPREAFDPLDKKNGWEAGETAADEIAVSATHNPDAGISGLSKIAREQIKEVREKFKKVATPEALDKMEKSYNDMLEWRSVGIRNAAKNLPKR